MLAAVNTLFTPACISFWWRALGQGLLTRPAGGARLLRPESRERATAFTVTWEAMMSTFLDAVLAYDESPTPQAPWVATPPHLASYACRSMQQPLGEQLLAHACEQAGGAAFPVKRTFSFFSEHRCFWQPFKVNGKEFLPRHAAIARTRPSPPQVRPSPRARVLRRAADALEAGGISDRRLPLQKDERGPKQLHALHPPQQGQVCAPLVARALPPVGSAPSSSAGSVPAHGMPPGASSCPCRRACSERAAGKGLTESGCPAWRRRLRASSLGSGCGLTLAIDGGAWGWYGMAYFVALPLADGPHVVEAGRTPPPPPSRHAHSPSQTTALVAALERARRVAPSRNIRFSACR